MLGIWGRVFQEEETVGAVVWRQDPSQDTKLFQTCVCSVLQTK